MIDGRSNNNEKKKILIILLYKLQKYLEEFERKLYLKYLTCIRIEDWIVYDITWFIHLYFC